jgi:hypothetical protein
MLGHWMPSSRDRFTRSDFDFMTAVLAPAEKRQHLAKLWDDPEALREILDLKEILRAILDSPSALQLSPAFYFYVLVRHAFVQANLTDPDVADYVAGLMAKRISTNAGDPLQDIAHGFTHAADFIAIISSAHGRMKFHLQVAAGNQFLVLTGLYPAFLQNRSGRRGAPDITFYESFARQAFRGAADNADAPPNAPRHLLGTLSEALPEARRSLNRMAEEFVFLGD